MSQLYDEIGIGYQQRRRPDPRLAAAITRALDHAESVVNVGVDDYFPEIVDIDRKIFPTIEDYGRALGRVEVQSFPVPHDCVDGFLGAYWRRPHAYLDAGVRAAISAFTKMSPSKLESGLERLRRDLADGTWERRYARWLDRAEVDLGYRIVIASKR